MHTATDPLYGALWRLALLTDMRRGELVALRWSDVDLDAAHVTVRRRATVTADGKPTEGEPKSTKGRRTIALPASCVDALRWLCVRQAERRLRLGDLWAAGDCVFDREGRRLLPDKLRYPLQRCAKELGVPVIRIHYLRHTAATLMLEQGVSPRVVQEVLGHGSITITLDRYSHVSVSLQRAAMDALDASLRADVT